MNRLLSKFRNPITSLKYAKSNKVFCIGRNKTGTTSMGRLFNEMGFPVAPQYPAELLMHDWAKRDFSQIIKFVKYYGISFQDVPFSLPDTYKVMDKNFPNSKFLLTIRDSPEVWYQSLTSYHSKLFGAGSLPTKEDLQNAKYVYPGWMWEVNRMVYNTPEDDLYNKDILIKHYNDYNASVLEYFKDEPEKLLVVKLKDTNALSEIVKFLNPKNIPTEIPWINKTKKSK